MISYLEGKIISKTEKYLVLKVNGVGFKVFLSKKSLLKAPEINQITVLFCFTSVKENAIDLYGFLSQKELEFFEILNDIRGIGPKTALEISSLGSLEEIKERISKQDEKLFEGMPGIGRKKAMTIILELSGKIKEIPKKEKTETKSDEAEETLLTLGFSRQKIKEALQKLPQDITNPEEKVKEALKILGK